MINKIRPGLVVMGGDSCSKGCCEFDKKINIFGILRIYLAF